jgi:hypothetical protein
LGVVEYAAAKAAGEALCRYLESDLRDASMRIFRLLRMGTDRAHSILALKANDLAEPADVMGSLLVQEMEADNQEMTVQAVG